MKAVRLPFVNATAMLLSACLLVGVATAQTATQAPASRSEFFQVLDEARATFSVSPLQGEVALGFGAERNGTHIAPSDLAALASFREVSFHRGVDYSAAEGARIRAPGPGRVVRVELNHPDSGIWLEIDHGQGLLTRYTHLSALDVALGDQVVAGQLIARAGHTGAVRDIAHPHLHFEVLSMRVHPGAEYFIDPELVLPGKQRG